MAVVSGQFCSILVASPTRQFSGSVLMTSEPPSNDSIVKNLAEACSTAAKIENRTWLGTIAVSVVLLLPPTLGATTSPSVELPLLGSVPTSVLSPLAFLTLAILIIALSSAHAQHIRADSRSHSIIRSMYGEVMTGLTPRDYFDILRVPSFTRVAPLAQWIRGRWQWESESTPCPLWRRAAGTLLYIVLKLVVLVVLFLSPGIAIWVGYGRVRSSNLHQPWLALLGVAGGIAIGSLVLITIADGIGTWPRIKTFASKN
jgi:hypothetical protein